MADQKEIDALIAMLDGHMAQGSGHINVTVNDETSIEMEEVKIQQQMDCDLGDTCCKIPNLPMEDDDLY